MKQEIVTQYLALKLKVSQMITHLQEQEGTITELNREILRLETLLTQKSEELMEARNQAKELEKNFKKSDKIGKIVVNTDNTAVPTAELKKKLDQYIVEIDHCIEQLRKP
jgi:predicted RNase H-like nuclease (RuvC/YqgF family)